MNLQIHDPRALELAERLAEKRKITPEEAVIGALEAQLREEEDRETYFKKLNAVAEELKAISKPGGRDMTKDEIDEMWGH